MWRISAISEDWVGKGCHIHIDYIELAARPDQFGRVIFRRVFSSTTDAEIAFASKIALDLLSDPSFRRRLRSSIARAMEFMMGVRGRNKSLARGRLREFHFLLIALDRLEVP